MPHSAEILFEVDKDVVDLFLVLTVFLAQYTRIEYLFCSTSSPGESSLVFGEDLSLPVVSACSRLLSASHLARMAD